MACLVLGRHFKQVRQHHGSMLPAQALRTATSAHARCTVGNSVQGSGCCLHADLAALCWIAHLRQHAYRHARLCCVTAATGAST